MIAGTHASNAGFEESLVVSALEAALSLPQPMPVFAISGLQGSGKSTLAAQIAALADTRGHRVAVLSIDDFYLRKDQRLQLAREVHPLLATRGPPGTHDLGLALETIGSLRDGRPTRLPRFDKLADEREPAARWLSMERRCDFVLLEGWFLKTPPQSPDDLLQPINALERDEDPDGSWRRWCNKALADDYPRLWQTIDALWFLQGPDFDVVPEWRWQQEQSLQASDPERVAMSRLQVERFVQLFERVSRQALCTLPTIADKTVALDEQRRPL
ncbi:kinase [Pseudoxanthomonas sacheonensis]|uniref:D-glycerate 3-kinase n=1 Tax=Pseudoxanthomonas sacheonensis TaxID=443615 RepID=A0ABU1RNM7_9GAMM|nr:D-glycerate 3-kinase [Pseudoxanthomonas sacheonensis]